MKYRNKAITMLRHKYLNPILKACDLKIKEDGKIVFIGADPEIPPLFTLEGSLQRTLLFIDSETTLNILMNNKEIYKAFNPFTNINHLMYLCDELVKNLVDIACSDREDIFDFEGDLREDIDLSQIIDIKRLPKDNDTVEFTVVKFNRDGSFENIIDARGSNSLSAMILCYNKIAAYINSDYEEFCKTSDDDYDMDINILLEKYENERRLNGNDLKKEKKELNVLKSQNYNIDFSGSSNDEDDEEEPIEDEQPTHQTMEVSDWYDMVLR